MERGANVINQQPFPVVKEALQQTLVDLANLSLLDKQAHRNIKGSRFRTLHLQLDETIDEVHVTPDDVTERLAVLGGVPDARAAAITTASGLRQFDASYLNMDEVYSRFEELLITTSDRIKATLDPVDDVGHLSNDMLIGIATGLEEQT